MQGSGASRYLAELLSRLKTGTASETSATGCPASSATQQADGSGAAKGAQAPTLSDQVIGALVMMQLQGSTPPSSSSTQSDPFSQAFSSLDTDSDGTISQSELESAIQNAGGTADEADTVFSALGGTDTSGISEDTFKQAALAGGPPPGGPHGGPNGGPPPGPPPGGSVSDAASGIFATLDSNQDGSVSTDELNSALSANSGTSSGSSSSTIFSAMDTNGDGTVSQDELTTYLGDLQKQSQSDQATLNGFLQLATQSYDSALKLFSSSSLSQGTTA
jgi:Ca2+-binding EF-hand superfamily protein